MTDPQIPGNATVVQLDREFGTQVMNQSDFDTETVMRDGLVVGSNQPLMAALSNWVQSTRPTRRGGLFERDAYVTPEKIFDQMALAYHAVANDDVVSNVADASESMAFNTVGFYSNDVEAEDIYNQIAADINLDARLRELWRELFTVSQFVVGIWWHTKTFKVRGNGDAGRKRRKEYTVRCPKALTLIDPLKVIPVGSTLFDQEVLVYAADRVEHEQFVNSTKGQDAIKDRLLMGQYNPSRGERAMIQGLGGDASPDRLWILNSANVFRHTLTKGQHSRFASVRMQSIFELLDLKSQLRQMDRAHLIGASNFILLITKGTDQHPAKPEEIAHLQASVRTVSKVPVMVGDHRLDVRIVTPSMDNTLKPERYNLLDGRITARLYHMFVLGSDGGSGAKGDDSLKLATMIARGMESRRHMIVRSLEANVFNEIFERNENLLAPPKLRFRPQAIDLVFDSNRASMILDLRDRGEISRETALSQFEFDQNDEALYLEREAKQYDSIFKTINPNNQGVPGNNQGTPGVAPQPEGGDPTGKPGPANPAPNTGGDPVKQRNAGRVGKRAGGAAPGTGQGKAPRNQRKLSSSEETGELDE